MKHPAVALMKRIIDGRSPDDTENGLREVIQEDFSRFLHPDLVYRGWGHEGWVDIRGRDAFLEFCRDGLEAISDASESLITIVPAGKDMALVVSGAYRTFKYLNESTYYEYAMLVRVENGVITYACDMLDREAADHWVRSSAARKALGHV